MSEDNQISSTISEIIKYVFGAEREQLRSQEIELAQENNKTTGTYSHGFRFNGHLFTFLQPAYIPKGTYLSLDPSLHGKAQAYLDERKQIDFDAERTTQALTILLRGCDSHQDTRDALPDSLKSALPRIQDLPRTRPEAYTLLDNPRLYRQYLKARERIDFYIATKNLGALYSYIRGQ